MKRMKWIPFACFLFLIGTGFAGFVPVPVYSGESTVNASPHSSSVPLPESAGAWLRPATSQHWDASNLFEYIDGAGELYIGYRFQGVDVYFYTAPGRDDILVELYAMKIPDDAFGLLSTDWGGDPVDLWGQAVTEARAARVPPQRALYGAGLLRFCAQNLYVRIMAYAETPESKEAVLSLGRAIASGRDNPPPPAWIKRLPLRLAESWRLVPERVCFFRSHLVLNSAYFLSQKNILNLDHSCDAVFAPYESTETPGGPGRIQALLIRYQKPDAAQKGFRRFFEAYLPEHAAEQPGNLSDEFQGVYNIEDGWLGCALRRNRVAILFECPDQQTAQSILQQVSVEIQREENSDDNL